MLRLLSIFVLLLTSFVSTEGATCADFSGTNLPCVEVPLCSTTKTGHISINKLSNGLGNSKSTSNIDICFDEKFLTVKIDSLKQIYYSNHVYSSCNDAIFNSDISEVFIAPWYKSAPTPHCYSEIDVSPSNFIFESGIYNPNLNHSGVSNYLINCGTSGITHSTAIDKASSSWSENLSIPWSVIDKPYGCPTASSEAESSTVSDVYRVNFYRVNELVSTSTCSSTTCEYMAWSPTGSNPPAFHEPTKFGYLVLQR